MSRVPDTTAPERRSAWPFRLALATALAAVPLVLFGGSVTTIGAGMAVDGWLVAEGHFLLFFPVDSWFRDTATFVEHTHRLFGVLVGLFAIGTLVATLALDPRRGARWLTFGALLAVCAQGALGGFRVLEDDSQLAFLHGAAAQAVFALLCVTTVVLSPRYAAAPRGGAGPLGGTRSLAGIVAVLVYAQVVVGAWYRHALRPAPGPEAGERFLAHAGLAVVVLAAVGLLALALARHLRGRGAELRPLAKAPARLVLLVGLQVVLGLVAWLGHRPDSVGPLEWGLAIAHVLGGGLLLAQTAAIWTWLGRLAAPEPVRALGLGEAS